MVEEKLYNLEENIDSDDLDNNMNDEKKYKTELDEISISDSIDYYLGEISKYPLLTAEEEQKYGQDLKGGIKNVWNQ